MSELSNRTTPSSRDAAHYSVGHFEVLEDRILLSTASGSTWFDTNSNGSRDAGEPGIAGVTVYADLNVNGLFDSGEPSAISDANGAYLLDDPALLTGSVLRQIVPDSMTQTSPALNTSSQLAISYCDVSGPSVIEMDDSGFAVISDGESYFRIVDANGNFATSKFASLSSDSLSLPPSLESTGKFVVTWNEHKYSYGSYYDHAYARVYATDGSIISTHNVSISSSGSYTRSDSAINSSGAFVVVWQDWDDNTYTSQILARAYDSSGVAGNIITLPGEGELPSVAMDSSDNFIVTWTTNGYSNGNILAQKYDASGNAITGTITVNQSTEGNNSYPDITLLDNGQFFVVWSNNAGSSYSYSGDLTMYGRLFNADGTPAANEQTLYQRNNQSNQDITLKCVQDQLLLCWSTNTFQHYSIFLGPDGNPISEVRATDKDVAGTPNYYLESGLLETYPNQYTNQLYLTRNILNGLSASTYTAGNFGNYGEGNIAGRIIHDLNGNGIIDTGETGIEDITVILDRNSNGVFDAETDISTTTSSDGSYTFADQAAISTDIIVIPPNGWYTTLPAGSNTQSTTATPGGTTDNVDFLLQASDTPPVMSALNSESDSGVADDDAITFFNNSTPELALTFTLGGIISGATIALYADGVLIGSATDEGLDTIEITTNETTALADGTIEFTARQTAPGQLQSANSNILPVQIDTVAPAAPAAPNLQDDSDSGAYNDDNYTNLTDLTFDITSTDQYYRAYYFGMRVGENWLNSPSVTINAYASNRQQDFSIRAVDAAGNISDAGEELEVTIDRSVSPFTCEMPRTDDKSPEINAIWSYMTYENLHSATFIVNGISYPASASTRNATLAQGVIDPPLADGSYVVSMEIVDLAGNTQSWTSPDEMEIFSYASVSGSVWDDLNGDGIWDDGEPTLPYAKVYAYADGMGTINVYTNSSGEYLFDNTLAADKEYSLYINSNGYTTESNLTLQPVANQTTEDFNIPAFQRIELSGVLWHDMNADGYHDISEPVMDDWMVFIDENDNGIYDANEQSTQTDSDGVYSFYLNPGSYSIIAESRDFAFGTTEGGLTHEMNLQSGQVINDSDFGISWGDTEIHGRVWKDTDDNGIFDGEDFAIGGMLVYLDIVEDGEYNPNEDIACLSDADGYYSFTNLYPGSYITRIFDDYTDYLTSPVLGKYSSTLAAGDIESDLDFSFYWNVCEISGEVWVSSDGNVTLDPAEGEYPLSDIVVFVDVDGDMLPDSFEVQTLTDSNGEYILDTLLPGEHMICMIPPENGFAAKPFHAFRPANIDEGTARNINFGIQYFGSVSGTVWTDSNGDGVRDEDEPVAAGIEISTGDNAGAGENPSSSTSSVWINTIGTFYTAAATVHLEVDSPGTVSMALLSPNGIRISLTDNMEFPDSLENTFEITFSDEASVTAMNHAPGEWVLPAESFSGFLGTYASGQWMLLIETEGDITLHNWSLAIEGRSPMAISDANGEFTITVPTPNMIPEISAMNGSENLTDIELSAGENLDDLEISTSSSGPVIEGHIYYEGPGLPGGWLVELIDIQTGEVVQCTYTGLIDLNENNVIEIEEYGAYRFYNVVPEKPYEVKCTLPNGGYIDTNTQYVRYDNGSYQIVSANENYTPWLQIDTDHNILDAAISGEYMYILSANDQPWSVNQNTQTLRIWKLWREAGEQNYSPLESHVIGTISGEYFGELAITRDSAVVQLVNTAQQQTTLYSISLDNFETRLEMVSEQPGIIVGNPYSDVVYLDCEDDPRHITALDASSLETLFVVPVNVDGEFMGISDGDFVFLNGSEWLYIDPAMYSQAGVIFDQNSLDMENTLTKSVIINAYSGVNGDINIEEISKESVIWGRTYEDLNDNGVLDSQDRLINGVGIQINDQIIYSNSYDINGDGYIDPVTESGYYCFKSRTMGDLWGANIKRPGQQSEYQLAMAPGVNIEFNIANWGESVPRYALDLEPEGDYGQYDNDNVMYVAAFIQQPQYVEIALYGTQDGASIPCRFKGENIEHNWTLQTGEGETTVSLDLRAYVQQDGLYTFEANGNSLFMYIYFLTGNIDQNGYLDPADIDAISSLISQGTYVGHADLNMDGILDELDRQTLISHDGLFNTVNGDVTLDGRVGLDDFITLKQNYGTSGGWLNGDINGDGIVNLDDFIILKQNYGMQSQSVGASDALATPAAPTSTNALEGEHPEIPAIAAAPEISDISVKLEGSNELAMPGLPSAMTQKSQKRQDQENANRFDTSQWLNSGIYKTLRYSHRYLPETVMIDLLASMKARGR